ncbi:MAG TPA: hypothetical protein VK866_17745 [Acidimicrobiales bacterium]|nr:hypothetical protein [Acidimicrobiales bacterium]
MPATRHPLRSLLGLTAASSIALMTLTGSPAQGAPGIGSDDLAPGLGAGGDQLELSVEGHDTEEGDPGDEVTLPFIVTASIAPATDVTFRFTTGVVGFGAEPGVDFEPVDAEVTLPAGETHVVVLVPVIPDDVVDDNDGLVIAWISDPSRGTITQGTAVAAIIDDDAPAGSGSAVSASDDLAPGIGGSGGDGEPGGGSDPTEPADTDPVAEPAETEPDAEPADAAPAADPGAAAPQDERIDAGRTIDDRVGRDGELALGEVAPAGASLPATAMAAIGAAVLAVAVALGAVGTHLGRSLRRR